MILVDTPRERLWKILAATWIPLLLVLYGVIQVARRDSEGSTLLGGAILFAVLLGIPAAYLPTLYSLGATVSAISLVQFVLIIVFTRWFGAKAR